MKDDSFVQVSIVFVVFANGANELHKFMVASITEIQHTEKPEERKTTTKNLKSIPFVERSE